MDAKLVCSFDLAVRAMSRSDAKVPRVAATAARCGMPKLMFYKMLVDFSLKELGIDPDVVATNYRRVAQEVGKLRGSSPEETALFIASQLPDVYQLELDAVQVRAWIGQRKLNPKDPKMQDALHRLGWQALANFVSREPDPTESKHTRSLVL